MVEIVEEEYSECPQTSEVGEDIKDHPGFTCEICIEPVLSLPQFQNHMNSCSNHSYCLDCIAKYIEAKIEEYNTADIICPGLECAEFLDPLKYHPLLPTRVFEKWCDALCQSTISKYQSAHCPSRDCSALILNECGEKILKVKCPNCKNFFCFECQVPWHAGYRCDETGLVRDSNDILVGEMMEKMNWQRCPVCKHGVERRSGCPLMRCRCGESFCYTCGRRLGDCQCRPVFFPMDDVVVRRDYWGLVIIALVIFVIVASFIWALFHTRDNTEGV